MTTVTIPNTVSELLRRIAQASDETYPVAFIYEEKIDEMPTLSSNHRIRLSMVRTGYQVARRARMLVDALLKR